MPRKSRTKKANKQQSSRICWTTGIDAIAYFDNALESSIFADGLKASLSLVVNPRKAEPDHLSLPIHSIKDQSILQVEPTKFTKTAEPKAEGHQFSLSFERNDAGLVGVRMTSIAASLVSTDYTSTSNEESVLDSKNKAAAAS